MTRWTSSIAIAALCLAGCFGTETGNPPFAPEVSGGSGGRMGIAPPISIEDGWMSIENVELVPECDASASGTVVRHEAAALELGGRQALETEPVLEEGDYCVLSLERVAWTGADPRELTGYTLALDTLALGGTHVRVRSDRTGTLRFTASAPFPMHPDEGGLLLFVDESLLFNAISLDGAEHEADGSIEIRADENAALLDQIEAQLPGALALYRDVDGDGRLSNEERDAGPLATIAP